MLEHATNEPWTGTPILTVPLGRKVVEQDIAWAMHQAAEETASLEEDRLALERLISGEVGMRPGGTPPKRTAVVRGGT